MEKLQRFESAVELGKKIVEELGMLTSCDTLARWMIHHISDLILIAETCDVKDRMAAEDRCRNAILSLWEHIYMLPGHSDVFSSIPVIIKTIKALDSDFQDYYYFAQIQKAAEANKIDPEVIKWLDLSRGIDFSARLLIRETLRNAAKSAAKKDEKWIQEIENAFPQKLSAPVMIRIVSGDGSDKNETTEKEADLDQLTDRREKLVGFLELSQVLLQDMETKIELLKSQT